MPNLITKSGTNWRYDVDGEGEDLLLLHGWGVNRKIWRQQSKELSKTYRVVSVDLPGHGESSWIDTSLELMAQDLDEILINIGIKQVSVLGSSLGGLLGFKYFELYPEKVTKMAFVGAMPKFSKSDDFPYGLDIAKMRKLDEQVETSYPEIINIFFRSLFTKEERASRRFKWMQRFRREDVAPVQPALSRYLDILEKEDLRSILEEINVPVLFINGEEDHICPKEAVAWMQAAIAGARMNIFEKCGHFPFLTKPYEFNEALISFLKG